MSEMIERVAQAIALAGNGGTWDDWYNDEQREFHRKRARAAIEAMREPTNAMEDAADDCDGGTVYDDRASGNTHWAAMIDAALADDKATKAA